MYLPDIRAALLAVLSVGLLSAPLAAQEAARPAPASTAATNELDAFMEKVLARREVNRRTLEQYVLDEVEGFEILGPGRMPLHRTRREYTWFVRDGMHVRSPLRFNGVPIGEDARVRYEENWIRSEQSRAERKAKREKERAEGKTPEKEGGEIAIGSGGVTIASGTVVPTEPRFVSESYFMDFKFEPGNYYLAGREEIEGHPVLKIEYYPTRMFGDDDEDKRRERKEGAPSDAGQERERRRDKDAEADIERRMNKTALITLWVDPKEHQIVKYTFDNVWMDFLPGGWLVKVDDIRASMTMGQPFPGVWLPRGLNIHAGFTLANGSFEGGYERTFSQYRLAEVTTKMKVPKRDDEPRQEDPQPDVDNASFDRFVDALEPGDTLASGPFVPDDAADLRQQTEPEVIGEIRIHGNAFLSDKEVLAIAGIAVGQTLPADGIPAITKRLKDSRLFESIDVRKRYRSLSVTSDIAIVLVVHENPGVRSAIGGVDVPGISRPVTRPFGRLRSKMMFLPIVSFADGYGFTYGGRVSTVDLLGAGERLSVPLTWGGTRRAALEFERQFKSGPLTRIESSAAIWNRENPRFDIRDQRVELRARAERVFGDLVRTAVETSRSTIEFGALDDRLWTVGANAALDTRLDPAYPSNAVYLGAGWTGLNFRNLPARVNRHTADGRGYLRVFRQVVVAGRAQYTGADGGLPPYERLLLGGSSSLRGFRTGTFDGDRMFVTSLEVRSPLTSVLTGAKLGMTVFVDAGKVWNFGQKMDDAEWHRGVGGGLFLIASVVKINLDIARGLQTGDTRVHLSSGFSF